MPKPNISLSAFAEKAKEAGLTLSEAETRELYEGYGYVDAMVARLRSAKRAPEAEPASVFKPVR